MAGADMERDKAKPARKTAVRPYQRPRGGGAKAIADLMPQIGRTAFRRFGFVQSSVVTRWPEIVGAIHARVCAPEAIRFPPGEKTEGILELVVLPANAPLIQHVVPEIIERVNRFFGHQAIDRVIFRQGRPIAKKAAPERPKPRPVPKELGEGLRQIADPELRACLESLATKIAGTSGAPTVDAPGDHPIPLPFRK